MVTSLLCSIQLKYVYTAWFITEIVLWPFIRSNLEQQGHILICVLKCHTKVTVASLHCLGNWKIILGRRIIIDKYIIFLVVVCFLLWICVCHSRKATGPRKSGSSTDFWLIKLHYNSAAAKKQWKITCSPKELKEAWDRSNNTMRHGLQSSTTHMC